MAPISRFIKSGCALAFVLIVSTSQGQVTIYVSPTGNANNPGTQASPSAITNVAGGVYKPSGTEVPIPAGSTIWLMPGTYAMPTQSNGQRYGNFSISGSPTAQTVIRSMTDYATGQRATIDGAMLIMGSYVTYWGLEVTDLQHAASTRDTSLGYNTSGYMGALVNLQVPGTGEPQFFGLKFVNLDVHDGQQGFGLWRTAPDSEIYGSIIHDNGYNSTDRGHGHGIYTQNYDDVGTKLITDNILFRGYGFNFHGYSNSSTSPPVSNYNIQGNISFNAGTKRAVTDNQDPNYLVTSGPPQDDIVFSNNVSYHKVSNALENSAVFGSIWSGDGGTLTFNNNYLTGQNGVQFEDWTTVNASNNLIASYNKVHVDSVSGVAYSSRDWNQSNNTYLSPNITIGFNSGAGYTTLANYASQTASGESGSTATAATMPSTNYVFVRPNTYEPGRGHVAVFNWQNLSSVAVNLSTILNTGDSYRIWNVESGIWGTPTLSGTYGGGTVNLPMTTTGDTPQFDAFLVVRTTAPSGPEVAVTGNAQNVVDGDTTPASGDHTDFGSVNQNATAVTRTFTVTNSGSSTLTLGSLTIPSPFTAGGDALASSLAANASDTFSVTLPTGVVGTYSGQISFGTNDPDENPFNFTISGAVTATSPEIAVSGNGTNITDGDSTPASADNTDFGSVAQGSAAVTKTFRVTNSGTATLTPGAVTVSGAAFSLGSDPLSTSITAGNFDDFTVVMSTANVGSPHTGSVSFSNNDSDENPFNFSIQGVVTAPSGTPVITVSVPDANAKESSNPATDTGTIRLTRTGSTAAALAVTFARAGTATHGATSDYVLKVGGSAVTTSATIPAGSATVDVVVEPFDQATVESSETVVLTVTDTAAYDLGAPSNGTVTIADNEPVVSITATDAAAAESGTPPSNPGMFRINLTEAVTTAALSVRFNTTGSSAIIGAGNDYTLVQMNLDGTEGASVTGSPVLIAVGRTYLDIKVKPVDDSLSTEADPETLKFNVMTAASSTYTLDPDAADITATVNIADNE